MRILVGRAWLVLRIGGAKNLSKSNFQNRRMNWRLVSRVDLRHPLWTVEYHALCRHPPVKLITMLLASDNQPLPQRRSQCCKYCHWWTSCMNWTARCVGLGDGLRPSDTDPILTPRDSWASQRARGPAGAV